MRTPNKSDLDLNPNREFKQSSSSSHKIKPLAEPNTEKVFTKNEVGNLRVNVQLNNPALSIHKSVMSFGDGERCWPSPAQTNLGNHI